MPIAQVNTQNIATIINRQIEHNWLVNHSKHALQKLLAQKTLEIENFKLNNQYLPKIALIESNDISFIAGFFAAIITKSPIFLCSPKWQSAELDQALQSIKPHVVWCNNNSQTVANTPPLENLSYLGMIGIPTGGSSGKVRFALHTIATLTASVQGFATYFESKTINCCCVLPLYHISGLIQLWRSLVTGGKLALTSYSNLKQNIKPNINPQDYFLSLVPTQLQYLLNSNSHWLAQFKTVLLGGAPAWRSLLDKARQSNIALSTTYGMTETASGISYLKPQDFLQGNYSSGQILPHVHLTFTNHSNKSSLCQTGVIKIQSKSLCYGYYPQNMPSEFLVTDDLGFVDVDGFLHIVGRNSQKIITGGENVYPQEVEAAILATKLVKDVCVIGLEDNVWGQVVTALYIPLDSKVKIIQIQQQLQQQLSKHKQPKHWFTIDSLYRDQKGKVNYRQLKQIAQELLQTKNQA